MKKASLVALIIVCLGNLAHAQTDTSSRQMYYYYPKQNVYFNQKSNHYIYYDSAHTGWKTVNLLPPNYKISKQTQKDSFYYNGADVWLDNPAHIKKYGVPSKIKQ